MWRFPYRLCIMIILLWCLPMAVSYGQLSTVGKEFWFGYMENNRVQTNNPLNSALDVGIVVITAAEATSGVLEYNGKTVDFFLAEGEQFFYKFEDFDILHRTTGTVERKGVYILTTGNVSVYAFNERSRSADGTVVLPISSLGKEYYVVSHFETMTADTDLNYNANINDESLFLIVAVEDNTRIQVTPAVFTLSGNAANTPFVINLNAGESYQVKAKADLTGSQVRVIGDNVEDCKNIAVFGGNKWTSVGNCGGANDHLFQQMYPVSTWGTDYLHVSFLGRSSGELVKVLASSDNTKVTLDGTPIGELNAGQFLTLDLKADQVASIQTDKPSLVTALAKSQECNDPNAPFYGIGDPFMLSYSPNQQLLKSVTFNAIQLPVVTNHYVNIITKTAFVGQTRLDGQNIGGQFTPFSQNPEFSYARISISQGVHRLQNPEGFIAYVYGFGFVESYGYAVGASLLNLNFEVEPEYSFEVVGEKVACLNFDGLWEIFPENEAFTYFLWDFGDGSEIQEGKSVNHTFKEKGEFEVKVIAAISQNSCDQQEEVTFRVEVKDVEGEIKGVTSVCPDVEEITYGFRSSGDFSKVEWSVSGGEIIETNEEESWVVVKWGGSNPDAFVAAVPYTAEGCPLEEIRLNVRINEVIESEMPIGLQNVCFDPLEVFEYSAPNRINGRFYEWFIEGGEIIEDDGSGKVLVSWPNPGSTGSIWFREFSVLDELCEGESPKLDITINNAFEISDFTINDVGCFGDQSGNILLNVTGGIAPYTFLWEHNPNLNEASARNLPAGIYAVEVTDSFGCKIKLDGLEVNQPELLEVLQVETSATSCFGKDDGEALIQVKGGVGPYSIDYPNATIVEDQISLFGLYGQIYNLEVKDANECVVPITFTIDSPAPIEVEVRINRPSCPGQDNGELFAIMDGTFAPYFYQWDYGNSNDPLLTDLPRGSYQVNVTDRRGCVSIGIGQMVEEAPMVRMPTGFRNEEGLYRGISNCEIEFTLSVFNRWGELIYNGENGWDGKVNGKEAPMGTYSYLIQYHYSLNGVMTSEERRGVFTLVR